jgi:tetratricopeptide (TPR) repeat protein
VSGGSADWDVFLAYPSPERARAQALYDALTAADLKVCFDQVVLKLGDDWHDLLPRHLDASSVVVALIPTDISAAHYARSELIRAIDRVRRKGRRLVPVRLAPEAELPYGTEQLHAADMFTDDDVPDVARRIAEAVATPAASQVPTPKVFCDRTPVPPRFFAGRDELLSDLVTSARNGATSVLTQTISGLGGVGKTSLAAALVEVCSPALDIVWWVRAREPTVLVADLAELGGELGLAGDDSADTAGQVIRWLETSDQPWMLVIDNAPDEGAIHRWLPKRGRGSVVVTSRQRNFGRLGTVVEVDTFSDEVAERFLRGRVSAGDVSIDRGPVDEVVARLQGLPLALEQAAAWVDRMPSRRFDDFARLFDDAARDPFPRRTRPLDYEETASTTWQVSITAASDEAPIAERLMFALVSFAPEDLPCQWLRDRADDPYLTADVDEVDEALEALHGYSLIRIDAADNATVHRVVQQVTRRNVPPETVGFAIRILRSQVPEDTEDVSSWPTMAMVVPHALTFAVHDAELLADDALDVWWVLRGVTAYQRESGAVHDALSTAQAALDLATTRFGPDDPDSLRSRNDLGRAWVRAGDPRRAVRVLERALADRETVLGPDQPDTLMSRHDLAFACEEAGDRARALALYEVVLAARQRVLAPDSKDTLRTRDRIATVLGMLGERERSVELFGALVADSERLLGIDHPETIRSRHNLAWALSEAGDDRRALPLYERVLADSVRALGPDHPDTFAVRENIAEVHLALGESATARVLMESTLLDVERVLGLDHPLALRIRLTLAAACLVTGDFRRAVELVMSVLTRRERVLGPDHPETKKAREELKKARIARARKGRAPGHR